MTGDDALGWSDSRVRRDPRGALGTLNAMLADKALPAARRAGALVLRARVHEALQDLHSAIADLAAAAALLPADARVHNELGLLYMDVREPAAAVDAFRRAVAIDRGFARAWNNLGTAQRERGDLRDAEASFACAAEADPAYPLAWTNLGVLRRERGDPAGAEEALRRALGVDPTQRVALLALAGLRRQQGDIDGAASLYTRATQQNAQDATAFLLLAQTLAERDDLPRARQAYDACLQRDPTVLRAAIGKRLTVPMIARSAAAVEDARQDFASGLTVLEEELPRRCASVPRARVHDELRWTNFLLAYQGGDDLALQTRYGDLAARLLPQAADIAPRDPERRRVRVGFASAFLRDSTVGRYFERWITDLPRERFDVRLFLLNAQADALTDRLLARADAVHRVAGLRPSQIAPRIVADALDVLVYPELGMDATTFALALTRLARVQCAGWGHPVTTGLRTIDAFFTSAIMEPESATAHYRELLVRLPGLGTRYAKPAAPVGIDDAPAAPVFVCPQSLFKIHPDNDALIARVLAAVREATLVMFEGRHPALTAAYRARLSPLLRAAGVAEERVRFLPQCSHAEYLRVTASCTAMLDTLHWSGGNTSLDALACALPIVTLPGRFMRGRQSAGMLAAIGVDETVARDADDYVRLAARLAREREFRTQVRGRLAAAAPALFDDGAATAAFATAIASLAQRG